MTDGPFPHDTRIVCTELNNGTLVYRPEVCEYSMYTPGTLYWKMLTSHPFDFSMDKYGTLEHAQKVIDKHLQDLEEQSKFKIKSITYIKYP